MRSTIFRTALTLIVACAALAPLSPARAAEPTAPAADAAGPYRSPMRTQCEAELAKDKLWDAELRRSLRPEVAQEDANITMTNKRHVVMGYAALWGLTVVFLVFMWLRQRRLIAEMDRLAQQIAKAASE